MWVVFCSLSLVCVLLFFFFFFFNDTATTEIYTLSLHDALPLSRAVLVVHMHGLPVDLRPILALARARGLVVIEDCSHAHGATLDGQRVGSFGLAGAFSLGVVKNLAAYGDAGLVSTDDTGVAERVKLLGTHGQARKNEHELYG